MNKKQFSKLHACLIAAIAVLVFSYAVPAMASAEGSFDRTLQVNGPVNLDVSTGSGNVEVHTGSSNQVIIHGRIRASLNSWFGSDNIQERVRKIEANPPIQHSGNTIRIGHIDDPELRRNISISYEITVPAETRLQSHTGSGSQTVAGIHGTLDVDTGSGSLRISDIGDTVHASSGSGNIEIFTAKGNVRARTGSGSIHATGIAGGFEGDTGSGNITLEQSAPGSVRVSTGSGSIELQSVRGSLEAKTGSGSIRANGDPSAAWMLHTGSGGVHLRVPSDASFDLNAHTGSGSISLNHPVTVQGSIGRKEVHGKVHGGGAPVSVETGSGSIEID